MIHQIKFSHFQKVTITKWESTPMKYTLLFNKNINPYITYLLFSSSK